MGLGSRPMHFAHTHAKPHHLYMLRRQERKAPKPRRLWFVFPRIVASCWLSSWHAIIVVVLMLLSCRQDPEATKCTSLTQHLIPKHPPSTWARPAPRKQVGNPGGPKPIDINWHIHKGLSESSDSLVHPDPSYKNGNVEASPIFRQTKKNRPTCFQISAIAEPLRGCRPHSVQNKETP